MFIYSLAVYEHVDSILKKYYIQKSSAIYSAPHIRVTGYLISIANL